MGKEDMIYQAYTAAAAVVSFYTPPQLGEGGPHGNTSTDIDTHKVTSLPVWKNKTRRHFRKQYMLKSKRSVRRRRRRKSDAGKIATVAAVYNRIRYAL